MESYRTVEREASAEFVEKRSKFIGYIKPVQTEAEAAAFIQSIKAKHWDATHNVYAYSLREGQTRRYSDDGEPQGTAGLPVLDVLQKGEVTDAVVVVTRYFGGILLGGGGLVRAYSHAASLAVEAGRVQLMRQCLLAELVCDYNQYGRIASLIPECAGAVDDTVFADTVRIRFHMGQADFDKFEKRLADLTCGAVTAEAGEKAFFAVLEP